MSSHEFLRTQSHLFQFSKRLPFVNICAKSAEYTKCPPLIKSAYGQKHRLILNWMKSNFNIDRILKEATDFSDRKSKSSHKQIWIFWWQGLDSAPDIVRACINSIVRHSGNAKINVITQANLVEFIKLPSEILSEVNNGKISLTFFSDILRMALLSEYGGFWIDATVYATHQIPESIFSQSFWTIKSDRKEDVWYARHVGRMQWTTYLMAGSARFPLFRFCYLLYLDYVRKFHNQIDYFLTDYLIYIFFDISGMENELNGLEQSNPDKDILFPRLNDPVDLDFIREIKRSTTTFYKLSYKKNLILAANGAPTLYSKLELLSD